MLSGWLVATRHLSRNLAHARISHSLHGFSPCMRTVVDLLRVVQSNDPYSSCTVVAPAGRVVNTVLRLAHAQLNHFSFQLPIVRNAAGSEVISLCACAKVAQMCCSSTGGFFFSWGRGEFPCFEFSEITGEGGAHVSLWRFASRVSTTYTWQMYITEADWKFYNLPVRRSTWLSVLCARILLKAWTLWSGATVKAMVSENAGLLNLMLVNEFWLSVTHNQKVLFGTLVFECRRLKIRRLLSVMRSWDEARQL
jgi:hypothetical protein